MKKVLIIPYTCTLGGGSERVFSDIVNNLDFTKYEISVLPYAQYSVSQEEMAAQVKILPSIVDMERTGKVEKLIKYFLVHMFPRVLYQRYIGGKYDIELSFNYQIPSFLAMGKNGAKVIQWNHGDIYDLRYNWLKRKLQGRSFRRADRIIAISENTKQSISDIFPQYAHKLQLIYNGVNIARILEKAEEKTAITLKSNSIVFLGRLEEAKQPLQLLDIVKKLISDGKEVNLYYLGKGEQENEIQRRITQWNLDNHVFLLGYQKNPYPIIKQGKAVCMLSKSEGFPTVFTEGMVLGKPFVSSNVGGVQELSNSGKCGFVVESAKECEEAITKLVLDMEINTRMGVECQKHIQNYSLRKQIETIEELLDSI